MNEERKDRKYGAVEHFEVASGIGRLLHRRFQDAREDGACVIDIECELGMRERVLVELGKARDELVGLLAALFDSSHEQLELVRALVRERRDGALVSQANDVLVSESAR